MKKTKNNQTPIHEPQNLKHEILLDTEYLKVRKNEHFIYAERKGIDSIAFILTAKDLSDPKRIGVIHEYKNPIEKYLNTAFGGTIDKHQDNLIKLVQEECLEEAGFIVPKEDVSYHGKYLNSTQMNQFTHLFSVSVDKSKLQQRTTQDPGELKSTLKWIKPEKVLDLQDWKTIVIVTKILASCSELITPNS